MTTMTDELLVAFVDGALDEPLRSEVAAAVASDPSLQARADAFAEAGRLVRDLHAPLASVPVPRALAERVAAMGARDRGPTVVDLASRRARRGGGFLPVALAAGLAALVIGPVGFWLGMERSEPAGLAVTALAPAPIADALGRLAAGEETAVDGAGRMRAIVTFKDAAGALCREFEVDGTIATTAVACRENDGWRVTFAVEAPLVGGYAPASSNAALDAYLDAIGAGAPLTEEEEKSELAKIK